MSFKLRLPIQFILYKSDREINSSRPILTYNLCWQDSKCDHVQRRRIADTLQQGRGFVKQPLHSHCLLELKF